MNTVSNDLKYFNETVNSLSKKVSNLEEHHDQLSSKMDKLQSKLDSIKKKKFKAVESQLEEYKQQTTSELAGLQNMFNVSLITQTSHLNHKLDTTDATTREDFRFIKEHLDTLNASVREDLRAMDNQLKEHKIQMTSELAGLQSNITSEIATLHNTVQSIAHCEQLTELSTKVERLDSKLDSVNASMREELRAMESCLEEHKNQTTSELAGLQNMFNVSFTSHNEHLSYLNSKMDILNASMREDLSSIKEDLNSLNETMNRINSHMEEHDNHVTTEPTMINECVQPNVTQPPNNDSLHTCGGTGGWRRVVYLDMTDPNTNCPSGWQLTSHSRRTCGKVNTTSLTCDNITFSVSGGDYTRVCGRIKGYQYGWPDGFEPYDDEVTTIDDAYVCGVSLTHGSPRQHIWTFAAGIAEGRPARYDICPCDATVNITIPPFVGGDYFCESGYHSNSPAGFHSNDPLWDGYGCSASSTCCSFRNPPYFTKELPSPTTDDIEARICMQDGGDDTPIELIELYVQ